MSEPTSASGDATAPSPLRAGDDSNLGRRVFLFVVGAASLVIAYLIGAAVLPRWWAQRVSDVIDGRLIFGNMLGFGIGLVFTMAPLLVLAAGWRFKKSWRRAAAFVIAALVVAGPNLLTLGIVIGSGNAAHAGERILDVDGPGFRGGSLVGSIVGAVLSVMLLWLMGSRRRNKRKVDELKGELEAR
jgi:MFS family permease